MGVLLAILKLKKMDKTVLATNRLLVLNPLKM